MKRLDVAALAAVAIPAALAAVASWAAPRPALGMFDGLGQLWQASLTAVPVPPATPAPPSARQTALAVPGLTSADRAWIAAQWPDEG